MRIRRTLLNLGLLLASSFAAAQATDTDAGAPEEIVEAPVYDIELVVFAYVDGIRGRSEDFAYSDTGRDAVQAERELQLADPEALIEGALGSFDSFGEPLDVAEPDTAEAETASQAGREDPSLLDEVAPRPLEFMPLPPDTLRLVEATRRMQINGNFETLLHTSWRQPVYGPEEETSIDLERLGALPPELGGTASIYVTRFLHLTLDLALADSSAPVTGMNTLVYRLEERRKMRSTELHFFDHPRFGALALISRYEPDDAPLEDTGTPARPSTSSSGN